MTRIEVKMKRFEKLKNGRVVKKKVEMEENSCGDDDDNNNCEINVILNGNQMPSSQGSIGSHGSGSLGITDFQSPRLDVLILFD